MSRIIHFFPIALVRCCLWLLLPLSLGAQGLQEETTPFSVWLDFRQLAASTTRPALPIWMEGVDTETKTGTDGAPITTFRLRLRALADFDAERQLRLFFEDRPGAAPTITGRSATGEERFTRGPLGQGLGLPTSENVTFATADVAVVEIRVPGDGRNVRGVFLATLTTQKMRRLLDFAAPSDRIEAFGQSAPLQLSPQDLSLFGRVKAALDTGTVKLTPGAAPSVIFEFELQAVPLLALVSFEILNADGDAPLAVTVNDRPIGATGVTWPDLADPGYLGVVRPLESGMRFRYTGWLRAQKVIPGAALRVGVNRLVLQLPANADAAAVRAVELQLKHNWQNLDYTLAPNPP